MEQNLFFKVFVKSDNFKPFKTFIACSELLEKWSSMNTDLQAERNLNCQLINKNLTQQGKVLYESDKISTVSLSLNLKVTRGVF